MRIGIMNNSINYPFNTYVGSPVEGEGGGNDNWTADENENNNNDDLELLQHQPPLQNHHRIIQNQHFYHQQRMQQNFVNNSNNNYAPIPSHHHHSLLSEHHNATPPYETSLQGQINAAATLPPFTRNLNSAREMQQVSPSPYHQRLRRVLVSVDGIQSGVPTLTTPTLTPTTMRSIEQTFYELTNEQIAAPYQAGFVPPSAPLYAYTTPPACNEANESSSEDSRDSWNNPNLNEDISMATTDTSSVATTINDSTSFQNGTTNCATTSTTSSTNDFTSVNIAIAAAAAAAAASASNGGGGSSTTKNTSGAATSSGSTPSRRNQGGRRPTKSANISPEEEEKRRVRRERNKLAAARCRKRRVDQTNELLDEVSLLEKRREDLRKQIESLNSQKEELEYILEEHRPQCQKIRQDLLGVGAGGSTTFGNITTSANNNNNNSNTITSSSANSGTITADRVSPVDLKPFISIKDEPIDTAVDTCDSFDDGPPSPKRIMLSRNNPMIPPPLPNVATLSPSLAAAASATLNTPTIITSSLLYGGINKPSHCIGKQRPSTLNVPLTLTPSQSLALNTVGNKVVTDINGVAITTPSTGMFNFDSLMDGGTGLTPVAGPLMPTCSSLNKHPLELATPTSESSKLVSL